MTVHIMLATSSVTVPAELPTYRAIPSQARWAS